MAAIANFQEVYQALLATFPEEFHPGQKTLLLLSQLEDQITVAELARRAQEWFEETHLIKAPTVNWANIVEHIVASIQYHALQLFRDGMNTEALTLHINNDSIQWTSAKEQLATMCEHPAEP